MTVTVYNARLRSTDGRLFSGSISWDKYTPRKLDAQICPHITDLETDYPVWNKSARNDRAGLDFLIAQMKDGAESMDLVVFEEAETRYSIR